MNDAAQFSWRQIKMIFNIEMRENAEKFLISEIYRYEYTQRVDLQKGNRLSVWICIQC